MENKTGGKHHDRREKNLFESNGIYRYGMF